MLHFHAYLRDDAELAPLRSATGLRGTEKGGEYSSAWRLSLSKR